ncbi:antibiotic biosynthesis monooxygenase family protein [Deminuibacter soli]|uniref:Antibiotic biosynthesis monooxygenase n=1 Tax=Deminuibacter soli TaxID=2291815 RepID=A0A3E1NHV3_9BACT|nr:antibiotic biosynthesis monooxygenase [Deminuibacter soli]RFM27535.1 antibiotic biosynthesis monooxygenase [Deminuibacter soli]
MITEVAILRIKRGTRQSFENAFNEAQSIIAAMDGYLHHELQRCIEEENKYLLLVQWQTLEDHVDGFRKHDAYKQWQALLHPFYDPAPVVEHFEKIY